MKLGKIIDNAVASRKYLHQHPELRYQESNTAKYIREQLDQMGIEWQECTPTGTLARLAQKSSGKHIALRGDIDALPIHEQTKKPWASKHAGCMHACGHDGHTATLLATAAWLKEREEELTGPVTLVFQPAEEGGHGAKKMIEAGALNGIDEIYGWHNWPAIPYGQAVCPDGPVMSANSVFDITVTGSGGHASQPEGCKDPVLAASAIVQAVQQIVSRHLPPQVSGVVSVTSFEAPSAKNVVPDKAVLGGGIRASDTEWRNKICDIFTQIVEDTARAYGCEAKVNHDITYNATTNHREASQNYREALAAEFGEQWLCKSIPVPIMASEDFSYYLLEIPGAFALIGADDKEDHHYPCHSTHYDFNDKLIERVTRVYGRLVGLAI